MKLLTPRREASFYETFSDLIFCTLVIFVVFVMALALKVNVTDEPSATDVEQPIEDVSKVMEQLEMERERVEELAKKFEEAQKIVTSQEVALTEERRIVQELQEELRLTLEELAKKEENLALIKAIKDRMVAKHRFGGAWGRPRVWIAPVPLDGEAVWTFVPSQETADLNLYWVTDETPNHWSEFDEVKRYLATVCEGGLKVYSEEEFRSVASAFSRGVDWVCDNGSTVGTVVNAIHSKRIGLRQEAHRVSVAKLLEVLKRPQFRGASLGLDDWLQRYNALSLPECDTRTPASLRVTIGPRPGVCYVGGVPHTARQVRALLRAVQPGRGFYVEWGSGHSEPESPPQWFVADVLRPTGYDLRLLSDEGIAHVEGK